MDENETLVDGQRKETFFARFKFPIVATAVITVALAIVLIVVLTARMTTTADKALEDSIYVNNLMNHLQNLQNIANENGNTRAAATPGYNLSVDYIVGQLQKHTDYNVTIQPFTFSSTHVTSISNLSVSADTLTFNYQNGFDFAVMGSPTGTFALNAQVSVANGYGCEDSDYSSVVPNTVILVKRGNCTFSIKANLAAKAQPTAVVIYNEGNTQDRIGLFTSSIAGALVPVFSSAYYVGQILLLPNANLNVQITAEQNSVTTMNIIAETKVGRSDRVIVIGSHLDSVPAGPGINDNGSGSALNIELAILLASSANQAKIKNKIRFCWWGAEELGLLGSHYYVDNLNATNKPELANIALNLNFDMIASPNFVRQVYNGSSDAKSPGSGKIQILFNQYYSNAKLSVIPTAFDGRSDYGPFLEAGIPAGGLATGAEVVKTPALRTMFGGFAGASYDPCYHQACDTIDNINQGVYGDMSKGAAHVLQLLSSQEDLISFLNTP